MLGTKTRQSEKQMIPVNEGTSYLGLVQRFPVSGEVQARRDAGWTCRRHRSCPPAWHCVEARRGRTLCFPLPRLLLLAQGPGPFPTTHPT